MYSDAVDPGFITPPNLPLPQGEGFAPSWVKRGKGALPGIIVVFIKPRKAI
jgi:hypothetical protein